MHNTSSSLPPAVPGSLRSLSVFFLPKDLLNTLTYPDPDPLIQSSSPSPSTATTALLTPITDSNPSSEQQPDKILSLPLKVTPSCRTCAVPNFASVDKQREHVKSDWHLYNLKQQLLDRQAAPISLLRFQEMLLLTSATLTTTAAFQKNTQQQHPSHQFSASFTSMEPFHSSDVAVQTLMSQLEINARESKLAESSDPHLLRQKVLQEQHLKEAHRSPILWLSSTLYGPSVQFGIYKNTLTNKGRCNHLVEHIKSIQFPVPPAPPKKAKVKRAARAMAKALLENQPILHKSDQSEGIEQDAISVLQKGLENEMEIPSSPSSALLRNPTPVDPTVLDLPAEIIDVAPRYWTMILLGGGHFAGMVIDLRGQDKKAHSQGSHVRELKIVAHKTFHRYTVRRKNGGAQSSFGAANSAGAMVRMYNERALKMEVRELLEGWSDWILQSECVFMHAPGNNKRTVFYEDSIMNRADQEGVLRSFPFVTRRPTLTELKRAYQELTTVKIMQPSQEVQLVGDVEQEAEATMVVPKSVSHTSGTNVANIQTISTQALSGPLLKLVELIKKGRVEAMDNYFARTGLDPSQMLPKSPRQEYDQRKTPTLLHLASFLGQAQVVQRLLERHGADPTATIPSLIKRMDKAMEPVSNELLDLAISAKPHTAYDVAKDKETRNAFRRAMAGMPDAWDWAGLARVPSALTPEREAVPQKLRQTKPDGKGSGNENDDKDMVVRDLSTLVALSESSVEPSLSTVQEKMAADREKRAQAAEARRAAQLSARAMRMGKPKSAKDECANCGYDLNSLSPFERFGHQCEKRCL
ncbi:hypothetical protein BGZ95_005436 [Linnemannia exigua]|uniref:VLRF1 domain-containing protein n=1 Tax=Linnemannia exigua TaxID=604196 RepID=A0AAD4DGS0_9FUNG|nr:hypothetical protein BGZ95_005436 [Linnemannia exigua]